MQKEKIPVSIVGAAGYSGIELVRILSGHPNVRVESLIANSNAGKKFSEVSLHGKNHATTLLQSYSPEATKSSDVVFIALPSGEAFDIINDLKERGKKIIDLGGDFRLQNTDEYKAYYGREHTDKKLLSESVYGLSELNRNKIADAKFISNPGCYATSIILPLVPLIQSKIIAASGISIISYSGISGAGKKNSAEYSFSELNDSIQAYKAGGVHQHIPEIKQAIKQFGGSEISFTFVPHLAPMTRGIYTTITAPLGSSIEGDDILTAFETQYKNDEFVALSPNSAPALKKVLHTNMIEIGWNIDPSTNTLVLYSAIDNLMKGAAGQAVQNMNIMLGFDEQEGL